MQKITVGTTVHYGMDAEHVLVYDSATGIGREDQVTVAQWFMRMNIYPAEATTECTIADLPGEYIDPYGDAHFLCGCGHYVTCGKVLGLRFDYCPNCWFLGRIQGNIAIPRPDRLTPELAAKLPPKEVPLGD